MSEITPAEVEARNAAILEAIARKDQQIRTSFDQEEREQIELAKYQRQVLQLKRLGKLARQPLPDEVADALGRPHEPPGVPVPQRIDGAGPKDLLELASDIADDKHDRDKWWKDRDKAQDRHLTIPNPTKPGQKPFDRWGTAKDFLEIAWCKGPPACSGSPHSEACRAGAYRQRKRPLR